MEILREMGAAKDYPFVSPCAKELNFIRPAATPIVFHSLIDKDTKLVYGGTLEQPFDCSNLAISEKSGRLYHKLVTTYPGTSGNDKVKRKTSMHDSEIPEYGLIRSSVTVSLSEKIVVCPETNGFAFFTQKNGLSPISILPESAEPGMWSLPYTEDSIEG